MTTQLYLVKARKVGGSVVLTCPYAIEGAYYNITIAGSKIVYTPVEQAVRESTANGMNKHLSDYEG